MQPSLGTFLARFPEFGCVSHGQIISVLAEAPLFTGANWDEYEELGAMLYAAHILSMQGLGDGPDAKKMKNSGVTSITSGSHKVVYQDMRGAVRGFGCTSYGARFEALAGNVGAKLVSVL